MNRFNLSEEEKKDILEQHRSRGYKSSINEQNETANINKAIQCFLNKKGITDDSNQSLKIDGLIGNYPKSKSAQAIVKYQVMIDSYPSEGVWGPDTMNKMPQSDKKMFKQCVSDHGNIFDKGLHWLNLD